MKEFLRKMKELFEDIPAKTKFLKDVGFNHSYIGFRYFLQGRNEAPSPRFMANLSEELDYDYITIPVKRDEDHRKITDTFYNEFTSDLEVYLERYEGDTVRTYTKNREGEGSVSKVIAAFEVEKDLLDPTKQLDVSDLF